MFENFLLEQLSRKVGKKITADEFRFNQLSGELEVRNLVVYNDMAGSSVLLTLASGHAKLNMTDLLQKKVSIPFASIDSLVVSKSIG